MTERLPPVPGGLDPEERALAARLARLGPHGEPSPALDARILAAARAGLAAPADARRKPARWPLGLGIAASVALAVGLAWQLRPLPEPVVYDEAASAVGVAASTPEPELSSGEAAASAATAAPAEPAPEAPHPPAAFRRTAVPEPETAARQQHAKGRNAVPAREPARPRPQPAPPPVALQAPGAVEPDTAAVAADVVALPPPPAPAPPAAAPVAAPSPQAVARDAAARRERAAAAAATSSPVEARAAEAVAQDSFADEPFVEDIPPATADSPAVRDAWLHRIRELHAAGDTEAARASLEEFVRRYPAFPLPEDLRPLLD